MLKVVTHSGSFHADDVYAVAMLQLLHGAENIEVVRSRDPEVIASGDVVVDVGSEYDPERRRFDHHQAGYDEKRENGIPYAAAGLVWRHYGADIAGSQEAADVIDTHLLQSLDAIDNTHDIYTPLFEDVVPHTTSLYVEDFRPAWESGDDGDAAFLKATERAREHLERLIEHARAHIRMQAYIADAYKEYDGSGVLELERRIAPELLVSYTDINTTIFPDRGVSDNYFVYAVHTSANTFETRVSFPKSWAGLRDQELVEASGVSGAVFCHQSRHLCVASSLSAARALAAHAQ